MIPKEAESSSRTSLTKRRSTEGPYPEAKKSSIGQALFPAPAPPAVSNTIVCRSVS